MGLPSLLMTLSWLTMISLDSYEATDATGKNTPKVASLDEDDEKWVELRHVHIADA